MALQGTVPKGSAKNWTFPEKSGKPPSLETSGLEPLLWKPLGYLRKPLLWKPLGYLLPNFIWNGHSLTQQLQSAKAEMFL